MKHSAALIDAVARLHYDGDKDRAKRFLDSSQSVLDSLYAVFLDRLHGIERGETDYDSPSWAAKQAHQNGEYAAYKAVCDLIKPATTR